MTALHVGVDLGQARDHTGVVVVERFHKMVGSSAEFDGEPGVRVVDAFNVVHVERAQPGSPYPAQVEQIGRLLDTPGPLRDATLTVDQTGVGRAVFDLFTEAYKAGRCGAFRPRGVTFTAGREEHGWNVPKRMLVSNLVALAQSGRLTIADGVPLGDALAKELKAFTIKVTASGNDTYEARRESDHDDLVCALLLAVWRPRKTMQARGIDLAGNVANVA
jgi:hypothetical protein